MNWMMRKLKSLTRRKPDPQARVSVSSPPGWSFETVVGSNEINLVIRDSRGKLQYRESLTPDRLTALEQAAHRCRRMAQDDRYEPTILRMPVPVLRLVGGS